MFRHYTIPASLVCVLLSLTGAMSRAQDRAESAKQDRHYVVFRWPMMVDQSAPKEIKEIAKKANENLKLGWFQEAKDNPVCCLWVQLERWQPNPRTPGYVIVIHHGGGTVTATGAHQMELALAHLTKLRREENGLTALPLGLITNYRVIVPEESDVAPKSLDVSIADERLLRAMIPDKRKLPAGIEVKRFTPAMSKFIPARENPYVSSDRQFVTQLFLVSTGGFSDLRGDDVQAGLFAIYQEDDELGIYGLLFPHEKHAKLVIAADQAYLARLNPEQRDRERLSQTWLQKGRIAVLLWRDGGVSDRAFTAMRAEIEKALGQSGENVMDGKVVQPEVSDRNQNREKP